MNQTNEKQSNSSSNTRSGTETKDPSAAPMVSSSSFNSFPHSSSSSANSSPINNLNHQTTNTRNTNVYNNPAQSYHQNMVLPNMSYFIPPIFGFPNMQFTDIPQWASDAINPYINAYNMNDYKAYNQQLYNFANYQAYMPNDYASNWQAPPVQQRVPATTSTTTNHNSYSNLKENTNRPNGVNNKKSTNPEGTYRNGYSYRDLKNREKNKPAESEAKPEKKEIYTLMQNKQVYTSAYPALPSLSSLELNENKTTSGNKETLLTNKNDNSNANNATSETSSSLLSYNSDSNKENSSSDTSIDNGLETNSNKANQPASRWSEIVSGRKNPQDFFQNDEFDFKAINQEINAKTAEVDEKPASQIENNRASDPKEYKPYHKYHEQNGSDYVKKPKTFYKNFQNYGFNDYPIENFNPYYNQFYNINTTNYTVPATTVEMDKSALERFNPQEFFYNGEKEGSKTSKFFVIKSNSKEDVMRSIKHGLWCSTKYGNSTLNRAFSETETQENMSVYLFFSVNTSGYFCGVAEMTSKVDFETKTNLWTQDKWKGKFDAKWIFVKDVPNSKLRHITLPNNENKPVTNSRDVQEIPFEQGVEMLNVFKTFNHTSTIFDNTTVADSKLSNPNETSFMNFMKTYAYASAKPAKYQNYSFRSNNNTNNNTNYTYKNKSDTSSQLRKIFNKTDMNLMTNLNINNQA